MKVTQSATATLKLTTEGDGSVSDILTFVNVEFIDNMDLIRKVWSINVFEKTVKRLILVL